MSVELIDKNGSLGQVASNKGFADADEAVDKLEGYSSLKFLFGTGKTNYPDRAAADALKAAHEVKDPQVRSVLVELHNMLKKAEEFASVQI